ncbi:MAG: LPS export ABC transporter periplasmic protein LptC [Sulfuriflexus sp.]|nr:LPS export ABC transporter periplasmic protein LptC [Sulfuriflexus sp.]
MNLRMLGVIAVLISLSGLAIWLQKSSGTQAETTAAKAANKKHSPDYFMEDFTITSMNEKGLPRSILVSAKMLHYPDDDSTELDKPFMTMIGEIGKPWKIKADRGWVSSNNELVLLSGNVRIDRLSGPNNRPVKLFTDKLRIHPESDFAETDRPVTMLSNKRRTTAIGMRAYIREGKLQLLDNVRVSYDK